MNANATTSAPIHSSRTSGWMRLHGSHYRRRRHGRGRASGQVMVLICVALVALFGMIAVVADFSFMQHQKNMMQTAADSAAMAGAGELNYGDVVAAGKADAATNGYADGHNRITVAINNPPSAGPNASNAAYVEAIVSKPEPTYFLRVLGVSSINVSARAVAYEGNGPNCIYVMDPNAPSALTTNGNVSVQSRCGILADSSASNGMSFVGNVSITAPAIGVVGNYTTSGGVSLTPTPKTGVIAASDPLAYVAAPTVGSCAHTNFSLNGNTGSSGSPYQLYAGTYCGGIRVDGNAWLHFNPGTYVLAGGGLSIDSNTVMSGTGVTFYNTTGLGGYGAISLSGDATVNLSAPTSGSLAGILFFQDRSIPSTAAGSTITGNASSTFDGAVYFPTTQVTFNGNSSVNGYSIVVADKLVVSGNSRVGDDYSSLANGSPIKGTTLAE
jgi:Putative Flp pilus-assembly TadE/G-like